MSWAPIILDSFRFEMFKVTWKGVWCEKPAGISIKQFCFVRRTPPALTILARWCVYSSSNLAYETLFFLAVAVSAAWRRLGTKSVLRKHVCKGWRIFAGGNALSAVSHKRYLTPPDKYVKTKKTWGRKQPYFSSFPPLQPAFLEIYEPECR